MSDPYYEQEGEIFDEEDEVVGPGEIVILLNDANAEIARLKAEVETACAAARLDERAKLLKHIREQTAILEADE